jgi:hypothetical protein
MKNHVYAYIKNLVKVRYKVQGFSFLPRQPVHSLLTGNHASCLRGRGLNFEELGGDLPGDDSFILKLPFALTSFPSAIIPAR